MTIGDRAWDEVSRVLAKHKLLKRQKRGLLGAEAVPIVIHILAIALLEIGFKLQERRERAAFLRELNERIENVGSNLFSERLKDRRGQLVEVVLQSLIAEGVDDKKADQIANEIVDGLESVGGGD